MEEMGKGVTELRDSTSCKVAQQVCWRETVDTEDLGAGDHCSLCPTELITGPSLRPTSGGCESSSLQDSKPNLAAMQDPSQP